MSKKATPFRRVQGLTAHLCHGAAPSGERMGGSLEHMARRSDDPCHPSTDVGTVKIFENQRIRVWDMCVESGTSTGFHRHVHDYIFLQIGNGLCRTDRVDPLSGEVVRSDEVALVPSKSCNWRRASPTAPLIHQLHNASPTDNYRQILVEFLEDEPRLTAQQVAAGFEKAVLTATNIGSGLLFENERCRVHDFTLAPHTGHELGMHHHTLPYFFVNTCGGPNGPRKGLHGLKGAGLTEDGSHVQLWSQDRDLVWVDVQNGGFSSIDPTRAEHVHKVWNDLDVPYCSFIVEIK